MKRKIAEWGGTYDEVHTGERCAYMKLIEYSARADDGKNYITTSGYQEHNIYEE